MGNCKSVFKDDNNQLYLLLVNAVCEMSTERVDRIMKCYEGQLDRNILIVMLESITKNTPVESLKAIYNSILSYDKKIINRTSKNHGINYYFKVSGIHLRMMNNDFVTTNVTFLENLLHLKQKLISCKNEYIILPTECDLLVKACKNKLDIHASQILNLVKMLITETEEHIIRMSDSKDAPTYLDIPPMYEEKSI